MVVVGHGIPHLSFIRALVNRGRTPHVRLEVRACRNQVIVHLVLTADRRLP